jgi:hypothetical protein
LIEKDQQRRAEISLEGIAKGKNNSDDLLYGSKTSGVSGAPGISVSSPSPEANNLAQAVASGSRRPFHNPSPTPSPLSLQNTGGSNRVDWDGITSALANNINNPTSTNADNNFFNFTDPNLIQNEYHFLNNNKSFSAEPDSEIAGDDEPVFHLGIGSRQGSMNLMNMANAGNNSFGMSIDRLRSGTGRFGTMAFNGVGMEISEMESLQNLGIPTETEWGTMFQDERMRNLPDFTPIPPQFQ